MNIENLRSSAIRDLRRPYPNYLQFTSEDWLDVINKTDVDIEFCVTNGLGYSLGMLITEYLYSKVTMETFDRLLIDVSSGIKWENAIMANFGISINQLYKDAAEYVYSEVQSNR